MPEARVRTLRVRPSRSADLAFNVPGVIVGHGGISPAGGTLLGRVIAPFDIQTRLYSHLDESLDQPARLAYDSNRIRHTMTTPPDQASASTSLFTLRNEALAATLDQAIDRREAMYLERVDSAGIVQTEMVSDYNQIEASLRLLITTIKRRRDALEYLYAREASPDEPEDWSLGVKKAATTHTQSPVIALVNRVGPGVPTASNTGTIRVPTVVRTTLKNAEGDNANSTNYHDTDITQSDPWFLRDKTEGRYQYEEPKSETFESSVSTTPYPQFIHPRLENLISSNQALLGVHQEHMRLQLAKSRVLNFERLAMTELRAVDQEIRGLQANFAHTFLFSPIAGTITAVYKDVGESVEVGEPVVRIEDPTELYAVGQIQYRGRLVLGQRVIISARALFEDPEHDREEKAEIVSIRGHETDDDEWDVILRFTNPSDASGLIYPLNYGFDPSSTTVVI